MNNQIELSRITRPELFVRRNPSLGKTIASLRWDIFNAEQNGLAAAGAILRVGRCIYIVESAYLGWMLGHRMTAGNCRSKSHAPD